MRGRIWRRRSKLSPNNARALYYRALVERNEGKLDLAIADFEEMARQYPLSRDAHARARLHSVPAAQVCGRAGEYEALQGIDPDDLAAHYNLAILYRRLGRKDKAAKEAGGLRTRRTIPPPPRMRWSFCASIRSSPTRACRGMRMSWTRRSRIRPPAQATSPERAIDERWPRVGPY